MLSTEERTLKPTRNIPSLSIFEDLESNVRSYIRSFPTVFRKASESRLEDVNGNEYIDFFAGAGALNYGHNPAAMKRKLLDYIAQDGITHSLDMGTTAKAAFLERFQAVILAKRKLFYKVMFPGPTGTNAVESALKLARKVTGRTLVVSFTNAFHGMTLGSLALTGNRFKRRGAGLPLGNTLVLPYDGYLPDGMDTADYAEQVLLDGGSGVSRPAAIILETVQGEGGVNTAHWEWLRKIENLCRRTGAVLIVDDVQAGCGRTGPFFSFEPAEIQPDIVCLSKSISGYGLPMALTLIRPDLDIWEPGEHNGTFRGHNLAFITATAALNYWLDDAFQMATLRKGELVRLRLRQIAEQFPELTVSLRGRGLLQGLVLPTGLAPRVATKAFSQGLLIETSGPQDEVLKILPPLTTSEETLQEGLDILASSLTEVVAAGASA